ncbi:hypothetical protein KY285_007464 [Solanum tuberosum]|nr:hypothetical protein KY285_007464 [Solanum tuberosum]
MSGPRLNVESRIESRGHIWGSSFGSNVGFRVECQGRTPDYSSGSRWPIQVSLCQGRSGIGYQGWFPN